MPLRYKINVLEALKAKGFSSYYFRTTDKKENKLSESTLQKLRNGEGLSWDNLETLCRLLECDIGDIVEFVKED